METLYPVRLKKNNGILQKRFVHLLDDNTVLFLIIEPSVYRIIYKLSYYTVSMMNALLLIFYCSMKVFVMR